MKLFFFVIFGIGYTSSFCSPHDQKEINLSIDLLLSKLRSVQSPPVKRMQKSIREQNFNKIKKLIKSNPDLARLHKYYLLSCAYNSTSFSKCKQPCEHSMCEFINDIPVHKKNIHALGNERDTLAIKALLMNI
jgi:hypothetical protein